VATTEAGRESIEREMEQTRERLAQNIDQLLYRASPKTIARRQAAAVKAYFVDPQGSPRTDNILKVAGGVVGVAVLLAVVRKVASD
jgi:AmiR/NasT family two-component response regulator